MEESHSRKRRRVSKRNNQSQIRKDFVTTVFSKELVLNVFSFLSSKDLVQCAAVSTEWYKMANDEMLWKPLFYKRFRDPLLLEDKRSKFHYQRRSSVTRYKGSWKTKYRVHHNWLLGNCYINDIRNIFDIQGNPEYQHLQFFHDIIFVVQSNSLVVNVWKYVENESTLEYSLESNESCCNAYITFLKFIQGPINCLVAGYSNGGFTVWEISGSCFIELSIKEITNYRPSDLTKNDRVISIGMEYPMIISCTESMKLSAFHINKSLSLELIHCLQNPTECSSIVIDIKKCNDKKQFQHKEDTWQAIACFGISAGGGLAASIGIQELRLSKNRLISSRYGYAIDYAFSNTTTILSEQITAMTYAPPFLITAHANNTMKQYIVRVNDQNLDISFKRKLYGHTFKVDVLAIDASKRKLVSGDRSSIRVWDLTKQLNECQVILSAHANQSNMSELPNIHIKDLGFDDDKIVAIINTIDLSFVRLWSFNSLLKQ